MCPPLIASSRLVSAAAVLLAAVVAAAAALPVASAWEAPRSTSETEEAPPLIGGRELARTQVVTAAQWCPGTNPPPPTPPPTPSAVMKPCNRSKPAQRWQFSSDGAISPKGTPEQCLTRDRNSAKALALVQCRGSAGRLDPVQQWKYNASEHIITTGEGLGCVCFTENPRLNPGQLHCRFPTCVDKGHPHITTNELFALDPSSGWIYANCSGINCPNGVGGTLASQQYCVTATTGEVVAPMVETDPADQDHPANHPANHPNCIPWSIDPQNTRPGWYFDAGMDGMVLTANDTLISIHEAEKFGHQDDNNRIDIIIRRSFTQGRTWEPFQLVHTESNSTHQVTINQGTPVLDHHTGRLWMFMTRNNSELLLTHTDDHGSTWAAAKDMQAIKPRNYGWIAPSFSGTQLNSGRLAVCADHIVGQWTAYPITHTISSVITSDNHGSTWEWQPAGSPDGSEMNECAIATLPNGTLVMNARNYIGQKSFSVRRAIMWSHDEGNSWIGPYLNGDLPDPIVQGSMIAGSATPPSLGIGQPLFFTNAHTELDRANDTLMMSTDGGARWLKVFQVQYGCSEYTGLVQFKDGRIGAGFDDGGPFSAAYEPRHSECKSRRTNETFVLIELTKAEETRLKTDDSCVIDATFDGVSLMHAQSLARAASTGCPKGTTIHLGNRSIALTSSLTLSEADSNQSWIGAGAELTPATELPAHMWKTAPADSRMDPSARGRIMAINLTAARVPRASYSNADATVLCSSAGGARVCQLGLLIERQGGWQAGVVARFPDVPIQTAASDSPPVNWSHTTNVPNISREVPVNRSAPRQWGFAGDRPLRWAKAATEGRLFVHGFFFWLWRDGYARIARVDSTDRQLITDKTVSAASSDGWEFPVGLNTTYFAFGPALLEELTAVGEFAVIDDTLFMIFPDDCVQDGVVTCRTRVSGGATVDPLISVQSDATNIRLTGLNLTASQGDGILIYRPATSIVIQDCHLSHLGACGISITNATDVSVLSTTIGFTGLASIFMTGGDRPSLTPANYTVAGCELHDFGLWTWTNQPGLLAVGVGIHARNNLFRSAFHVAVLFEGNDIIIERNEFRHVVQETFDAGAVYTGRDLTYRGNAVRGNFFHHVGRPGAACNNYTNCVNMAVYIDDSAGGLEVTGNIMWSLQNGFYANHGADNTISNNLFLDVSMPAISTTQCYCDYFGGNNATIYQRLFSMPFRDSLWRQRYPRLQRLLAPNSSCTHWPTKQPGTCAAAPLGNVIQTNLVVNLTGLTAWDHKEDAIKSRWHLNVDGMFVVTEPAASDPNCYDIKNNLLSAHPGFASVDPRGQYNFSLGPESPMWSRGWQQIRQDQIGPEAYHRQRLLASPDAPAQEIMPGELLRRPYYSSLPSLRRGSSSRGRVGPGREQIVPDIGFDNAEWTFPRGVKVERGGPNGTTICIKADPEAYIKASVIVPKPTQRQYYFIADTRLHGIVPGGQEFDCPKLKVNGVEHMSTDYLAQNLQMALDNVWTLAALEVTPSKFVTDTHLNFEIGMQQVAKGEFCVRAPRLSSTVPSSSYSYPFPAPPSNLVDVTIHSQDQRPFLNDLLSANSQLTSLSQFGVGYHSPQVQELLHWLHLPTLRFPGGTVGNFYNWKTDTFYNTSDLDSGCTAIRSERTTSQYPFGFSSFAEAMNKINSSVILMFNVIEDNVSDSVERLKARTPALPRIDWIELGNENYGSAQSCGLINPGLVSPPRAEAYEAFTVKVVAGLRSAGLSRVPPLAAPVSSGAAEWVAGGWNNVLTNSSVYDGFVMHPYVGVDDAFFTAQTAGKMLLASGKMLADLRRFAQYAGKQRPLLVTEFGILGTTTGTFLQTLGQASMFLSIVELWRSREVNIRQAGIHILLAGSPTSPSALFAWDREGNKTVATPTGAVWWKFVQVLQDSVILHITSTKPQLPGGTAAVDVLAVQGVEGDSLLVVNKLGVAAEIRAGSTTNAQSICGVEIFTKPPLSWDVVAISDVESLWIYQPVNASRVMVPPVSIAVVQLCKTGTPLLKTDDAYGQTIINYRGSTSQVVNPERGFRLELDQGCDSGPAADKSWAETLADASEYNLTVIQTYCYLVPPSAGTHRVPAQLSPAVLGRVTRSFSKLRQNGVKALFRFAYDRSMPGTHEYSARTILGHIDQLKDVVIGNADALYVLQAGFIGSWGEWHSSIANIHANASAVSTIVEAELFTLLPPDRKMQVRVPVYKISGALRRSYSVSTRPAPPPSPATCSPPTPSRVACPGAFGGINATQCLALPAGCCFFVNQTKPGPQCYRKTQPTPAQVPIGAATDRMAFGIAQDSTSDTAVSRIGFDNDGFMSTTGDGGSWGGYRRDNWREDTDGDSAPFPRTSSWAAGSLSTPTMNSEHGPMTGPDYEYAKRESAFVPIDGEMFWFLGAHVYDKSWPEVITAETAAWRLREMHYSTLSFVHGFLDAKGQKQQKNETIARWMATKLDVERLRQDRLPISSAYAAIEHTGFDYIRDHLGYRLELQWAALPTAIECGKIFNFSAALVNWGFAAPINPRPVLLVLLSADAKRIVWRSAASLADPREWQPHLPGDPTYSVIEHSLSSSEVMPNISHSSGALLPLGLMLPDARMGTLAATTKAAAAYSIRLANEDMGWVALKGEGAVNIIGHSRLTTTERRDAPVNS